MKSKEENTLREDLFLCLFGTTEQRTISINAIEKVLDKHAQQQPSEPQDIEAMALEKYPDDGNEFEKHMQQAVGAGYDFDTIFNNLESEDIEEEAQRFAREAYKAGLSHRSEWVSVEDRLPEKLVGVLGYIQNQNTLAHVYIEQDGSWTANYDASEIECIGIGIDNGVTHWQPLPQPPKD